MNHPLRLPQPAGDPLAAQQRVINALLEDIADPTAKGFPRVDKLRREEFGA